MRIPGRLPLRCIYVEYGTVCFAFHSVARSSFTSGSVMHQDLTGYNGAYLSKVVVSFWSSIIQFYWKLFVRILGFYLVSLVQSSAVHDSKVFLSFFLSL